MKKNIQSYALPKSENITEIKTQEHCYTIEDLKTLQTFFEGGKYINYSEKLFNC